MASTPWNKAIKVSVEKQFDGLINWKAVLFSKYNYQYRTNQVDCDVLKKLDLIIGYNGFLNVYIAWNVLAYNKVKESEDRRIKEHTFAVNYKVANDIVHSESNTGIYPIYCSPNGWRYNKKRAHDKAVLIKPSCLFRFCEDPFAYLMPDPDEKGFLPNTLFASPEHKESVVVAESGCDYFLKTRRERIMSTQVKRNPYFRDIVFQKYNPPHCIVCGEKTREILEAAHFIAVKDGGADTAENGLCLCRIHHKLFDAGMISIHLEDESFSFNQDFVAKSLCFEAGKKYPFE